MQILEMFLIFVAVRMPVCTVSFLIVKMHLKAVPSRSSLTVSFDELGLADF